jgi:hypothetical protein
VIERSGERWSGDDFGDLTRYLTEFTARIDPAGRIARSECGTCGGTNFGLQLDDDEGCARRTCTGCGTSAFIGDSAEYWEDAEPGEATCPCGATEFEVGVAFSLRDDGEVSWITVGGRCTSCGLLGVYTDWKIDYRPSGHLLSAL